MTIFNPLAPKRIFNLVPEIKLIIILRNPTERAISQYFHEKRKGFEPLSIMEALREEESRLENVTHNKNYVTDAFIRHSYKARGRYRQQIERFLNYFPREQLLILNSDEFFCKPNKVLRQTFKFVGVDEGFKVKDLKPSNVAMNKSKVDKSVYQYLNDYFLPFNEALYELVGEDYGW